MKWPTWGPTAPNTLYFNLHSPGSQEYEEFCKISSQSSTLWKLWRNLPDHFHKLLYKFALILLTLVYKMKWFFLIIFVPISQQWQNKTNKMSPHIAVEPESECISLTGQQWLVFVLSTRGCGRRPADRRDIPLVEETGLMPLTAGISFTIKTHLGQRTSEASSS